MNPDTPTPPEDDLLLDALLEEVLGGHAPPDLSSSILKAHARAKMLPPSASVR